MRIIALITLAPASIPASWKTKVKEAVAASPVSLVRFGSSLGIHKPIKKIVTI